MYNKSDSRIVLIGGSGLIGSNLNSYLIKKGYKVISTFSKNPNPGMVKFDFTCDNLEKISEDLNEKDIFIILAAYGNPSWIAENKEKAYELNVKHTINLIDQISKIGSKIYFMSSVEIFDGSSKKIVESTKPNPLNYYGNTKLLVEEHLIKNCSNYHILRTGWNVDINSKSRCVVTLTYKTLLGNKAKMAKDNSFTITHTNDLSVAIEKILFKLDKKILHLCSPDIVSRIRLADIIIENSKNGNKMKYEPVLFSEIKYNEPRSRMNNLQSEIQELNNNLFFRPPLETIKEKVKYLDNIL